MNMKQIMDQIRLIWCKLKKIEQTGGTGGSTYTAGKNIVIDDYEIDVDIPDNPSGEVISTTLAKTGNTPYDLLIDSDGTLYTANFNGNNISKITPDGVSTILASVGTKPYSIILHEGFLYTANSGSNNVSKVAKDGSSSVIFATTGNTPKSITVDSEGNFYTADNTAGTVTKISPEGVSSTLASGIASVYCVYVDSKDNLYVLSQGAKKLYLMDKDTGAKTEVASTQNNPFEVVEDLYGNLYIPNHESSSVTKVTPEGVVTNIPSLGSMPHDIAVDSEGIVYVCNHGTNTIARITQDGNSSILGTTGVAPFGIVIGLDDNTIYTANSTSSNITKITIPYENNILSVSEDKIIQRTYIPKYVAGDGIEIDRSNPRTPVISSTGDGSGDFIPLSGTKEGKPVDGDIEFVHSQLKDISGATIAFNDDQIDIFNSNKGISLVSFNNGISILDESSIPLGLNSEYYYGANYTDNTYVQKKYVDDAIAASGGNSYSTQEIKTGGTWIDGKPIYRKVITFDITTQDIDLDVSELNIDKTIKLTTIPISIEFNGDVTEKIERMGVFPGELNSLVTGVTIDNNYFPNDTHYYILYRGSVLTGSTLSFSYYLQEINIDDSSIGSMYPSNASAYVIIEYTKTTD